MHNPCVITCPICQRNTYRTMRRLQAHLSGFHRLHDDEAYRLAQDEDNRSFAARWAATYGKELTNR